MDRLTWPTVVRAIVGILVAGFVAGSVLLLVVQFDVLGVPPDPRGDFIEDIVANFEFVATRRPVELAGTGLFAIGFAALGLLGPTLAALADPADARRGLLSASFLLAGGLGVAGQLLWIGAEPVAARTQYCECGLLAEEIMARLMALDVVRAIQAWLVNGAIISAAVGLLLAVPLGRRARLPSGWGLLAYAIAAVALLSLVLRVIGAFPYDIVTTVVVAAILLPAWAIWLAIRAEDLADESTAAS